MDRDQADKDRIIDSLIDAMIKMYEIEADAKMVREALEVLSDKLSR